MIIEPIRLFADALSDATHGVNAQLAAFVAGGYIDGGDVAPGVVTVGDESRNAEPAIGRPMESDLSVIVFALGVDMTDPIGQIRYGTGLVTLGARVDSVNDLAEISVQDTGYIVRAMLRSARWWFRDSPDSARQRNGVQLINGVSIHMAMFSATSESPRNTYGIKVFAEFRDAEPN